MQSSTEHSSLGKRARDAAEDQSQTQTKKRRVAEAIEQTDEGWQEEGSPSILPDVTKWELGLPAPEPITATEPQPEERVAVDVDVKPAQSPAKDQPLDPKDIFPFMKLPAELRVHIYRMALQRNEALMLHAERLPERGEDEAGTPEPGRFNFSPRTAQQQESSQSSQGQQQAQNVQQPPRRRYSQESTRFPEPLQPPLCCQFHSSYKPDPNRDIISPAILRLNSTIYKESRQVLYADNTFTLSLSSGIHTLSTLHQRSRSLIKSVTLTIPSHHDILDGFADLVRLGLRYCWGLKKFTIVLQASLPDDRMLSGATSVYANAFHILRWLPKGCKVVLEGNVSEVVRRVVSEEGRLQEELDETSYLKRQHQMPERH